MPSHGKQYNFVCAPSKDSEQPEYTRSLIRAFARRSIGTFAYGQKPPIDVNVNIFNNRAIGLNLGLSYILCAYEQYSIWRDIFILHRLVWGFVARR